MQRACSGSEIYSGTEQREESTPRLGSLVKRPHRNLTPEKRPVKFRGRFAGRRAERRRGKSIVRQVAKTDSQKSRRERVRWFVVAGVFTGIGLGLLKVFVAIFHWPYAVSTFVQSEICTLLRFLAVDRWVFKLGRPSLKRLWQYHVANAAGFAVWWLVANALKEAGMNYLLASLVAMLGSVGFSLLSNFGWIWKRREAAVAQAGRVD